MLIAIEGIDGGGKTTQCNLLKDWLISQGFNAITVKEPSNGKYGQQIRLKSKYTRDFDSAESELDLFVRDRKENVKKHIRPGLEKDDIIIMDRYYFSTIAYQSVLGIGAERIKKINEEFAPKPNLTIIIDVKPNIGIKRITGRGDSCDSFEDQSYLEKVREVFLSMINYENVEIVDGNSYRSSKDVFQDIKNIVEPIIKKKLIIRGK
ncbi:MAG: dTMP kinase [Candidatus Thermoplasmatota archaeon]|nr:dTMP kinase [Candidatus Thermoplasmatota archaeon]